MSAGMSWYQLCIGTRYSWHNGDGRALAVCYRALMLHSVLMGYMYEDAHLRTLQSPSHSAARTMVLAWSVR